MIFFAFLVICYWLIILSWEIHHEKDRIGKKKKK